jgi:hypothetical protein
MWLSLAIAGLIIVGLLLATAIFIALAAREESLPAVGRHRPYDRVSVLQRVRRG